MRHLSVPLALCLLLAACSRVPVVQTSVIPAAPAQPPSAAPLSEDRQDEAEEAAAFCLLQRAPDGRNLPVERLLRARESTRRMRTYSSASRRFATSARPMAAAPATGNWVPLGPGNIGGRTRALVIRQDDPTIM